MSRDKLDCSRVPDDDNVGGENVDFDLREMIADCFVTGDWNESEDAKKLLEQVRCSVLKRPLLTVKLKPVKLKTYIRVVLKIEFLGYCWSAPALNVPFS